MIKDFLKHSAIYGIGKFIAMAIGFLTLPIITTSLSPAEYGIFDLLNLCLILLNLSIAMEVSQAVARFINDQTDKKDKQSYVSTAYFFSFIMYCIGGLIIYSMQSNLSEWILNDATQFHLILYLIPWLFLHGSFTFITNQFRWENKPREQTCLIALNGVLTLGFIFYFLTIIPPSIENLIQAYLLALSISTVIGFVMIKRHAIMAFTFSPQKLKIMLLFSLPLVPSSLAVFGQSYTDRVMIGQMINFDSLGIYGVAFKVANLLSVITGVLQLSVVPLIYKHHKENDAQNNFGKATNIYVFIILSTILGISLFSPELFHFFIGQSFEGAIIFVPLLLAAIAFQSLSVFTPGLSIVKKTHYIAVINIAGFGINIILNYIMIQYYGLMGAALATTITAALICIANIIVNQRHYTINYDYLKILFAMIVTALAITITSLISPTSINIGFFVTKAFISIAVISIIGYPLIYRDISALIKGHQGK
jgi:O-antigen/teichoic acid export membrane protein